MGSMKAFDLIDKQPELREKLRENTTYFRREMTNLGFDIIPGSHPIVPVMIGDEIKNVELAKAVNDQGIFCVGFSFPESLNEYDCETMAVTGDVTKKEDVEKAVKDTVAQFGQVDILINNAGVLRPTAVINIDEKEWDWVVAVNLKGTFLFSQAVLKIMRKNNWGRIVNFSSTAGKNISTVGGAHYTSAKAGILGFTRHLAKEEAKICGFLPDKSFRGTRRSR